jgi:hypothetical protein
MVKVSDSQFMPADYAFPRYAASVPIGTTLEDVLQPDFFGNCIATMRRGMEISVMSEDFSLDVRLRVLSTSKTTAKLRVLDIYAGAGADAKDTEIPKVKPDSIEVTWGGPNHKWRFLHGGSVVEHGFATEGEAEEAAASWAEKANG